MVDGDSASEHFTEAGTELESALLPAAEVVEIVFGKVGKSEVESPFCVAG